MAKAVGSSTKRTRKTLGRDSGPDVGRALKRAEQRMAQLVDDLDGPGHAEHAVLDEAKLARKTALKHAAERAAARRAASDVAAPSPSEGPGTPATPNARRTPAATKAGGGKSGTASSRPRRAATPRKPSGR